MIGKKKEMKIQVDKAISRMKATIEWQPRTGKRARGRYKYKGCSRQTRMEDAQKESFSQHRLTQPTIPAKMLEHFWADL